MWAAFGGFENCRVQDVQIESNWTRAYGALKASIDGFHKIPWWARQVAVENVLRDLPWFFGLTDAWGESCNIHPMRGIRPF